MSGAIRQIMIRGRVQGVGYRAWIKHQARLRRLDGWARNRRDGSVEALFAGPPDVVSEMIAVCRRGPPSSRVEVIEDEPGHSDALNLRHAGEAFSLLPTV
jgi:acylphosphatase